MDENKLSKIIVDCCYKIHSNLGPGLMESIYREILIYELKKNNLSCESEVPISVQYDNKNFGIGYRVDIIIDKKVIIELKSVENILPVHRKQLLTYLKVTGLKLGLLINFNETLLKNGITRIVNNL